MYGLSFPQYLDWYVTDSHTKMCYGDQFFSVILVYLYFCFVSGMNVLYLSKRYGYVRSIVWYWWDMPSIAPAEEAFKISEQIGKITFEIQF